METAPLLQHETAVAPTPLSLFSEALGQPGGHDAAGVIWITGYSGAGKTTVARKVHSLMRSRNQPSVLLDGDDLRGIFGNRWGYEPADRLDLAHVYFRLCNTLAAQGVTVVISAIAMYEEVTRWFKTNIDRSLQVFLDVPEQERAGRDIRTKNVVPQIGEASKSYQVPSSPDLVIENFGDVSPDVAAERIVEAYREAGASSDKGREEHWKSFYSKSEGHSEPTTFARHVAAQIPTSSILEVGCGDGRDASFLAAEGHQVTAIDPSGAAIALCRKKHGGGIRFLNATLPEVVDKIAPNFDLIYSRFCLHAMTEPEEIETLEAAYQLLKPFGKFHIECRSIHDPMARKGEVISPTERIHGHYRRFIIREDLHRRLERSGFAILDSFEADNIAAAGDDNPVVIRIVAEKQ